MENNKTETVVFLGADISYIAGVPIQSEILKEICSNSEITSSKNGSTFINFIKELVQKFLDFFLTHIIHIFLCQ